MTTGTMALFLLLTPALSRGGIGIYTSSILRGIQFILPPPVVGEGRGGGRVRRGEFPPHPSLPPSKGEGVQFLDRSLAFRVLCRYQCAAGSGNIGGVADKLCARSWPRAGIDAGGGEPAARGFCGICGSAPLKISA